VRGLGRFPEGIGGVVDHVHLLVGLKATHCLSDFLRELKKASSSWVHQEMGVRGFPPAPDVADGANASVHRKTRVGRMADRRRTANHANHTKRIGPG
jgi:hypothetical protein